MNDIHTILIALEVLFLIAVGVLSFMLGALVVEIYKAITKD